jgi:hypothetical protein
MTMLSEDDGDLRELSDEALCLAWDLWFDLAQATNDADPPYSHGAFQRARVPDRLAGWDGLPRETTSNRGRREHP